ncbi:MAG: keto-hydroxyglutarate-aldolase/keto-deoxy-phosphogluconate aldolase, partial [Clostridia bacterium]
VGLGKYGHIAIKAKNIDRAVAYLERTGVSINWDSAKKNPNGSLIAVYLEDEFGGFAVHIVQAK